MAITSKKVRNRAAYALQLRYKGRDMDLYKSHHAAGRLFSVERQLNTLMEKSRNGWFVPV